jgi:MFS-type transporter involved in bile tolerance (Atg22 family)
MMMPKGKENMFFGIIGVASRASAWFGPLVVGVIAQKTGNLWLGWPFISAMFVVAFAVLYSVDMEVVKPDLASSDSGIIKET